MENKNDRWKVIRFDLMAKIVSIFYLTICKLIRRNCNGLTDSSTLQIANDPKLILKTIPEQVVFKMDLEIRKFISWNHSIQLTLQKVSIMCLDVR